MAQRIGAHMTLSLDGFGTGPNQRLEKPFGDGEAENLHRWMFEDGDNNRDELAAGGAYEAYVMGRNMFGGRGEWDLDWKGWWGGEPPYAAPVFVLTHYKRQPLVLDGTTIHFVTEGPESALAQASAAAGGGNVGIAGGVSTLRHYLNAGAVDTLHLQIAPLILGAGERLWDGLNVTLEPTGARYTRLATHLHFRVTRPA